ncbi:MAG: type III-A CRISPR-associated RAMP protein Csm5 [Candidatus Thermoplasmatota archaeon]
MKNRLELEVLTPLHVGNGNVFTSIDFVIENKNFIKMDFDKFAGYCIENNISLVEEINKEKEDFKMEDFLKKNNLNPTDFSQYSIPMKIDFDRIRNTKPQIREFIKNIEGFPYIPGSSIKGAIRTALLWKIVSEEKVFDYCKELLEKKYIKPNEACIRLEKEIFGKEPHYDILRALRISDTLPFSLSSLEINEIKIVGNPRTIPTYIESIKRGEKTSFYFRIDNELLNKHIFKENLVKEYMKKEEIFKICSEFSKEIILKQLNYKFSNVTKNVFYKLKDEIENCKENEMILNLGWGGGWHAKTIGLKAEKFEEWEKGRNLRKKLGLGRNPKTGKFVLKFPKTRRVSYNNEYPLGWVKIRG